MKILRIISAIILIGLLNGCYPAQVSHGGALYEGQYTTPTEMGGGKYLTEGYYTRNAITSATNFCSQRGKIYDVVSLSPSESSRRATLIFKCVDK